jgi:hypothetical protein
MALSRKTIFAILLVALGLGFAMLVLLTYTLSGGSAGFTLAFIGAAVACIIAGTLLAFSKLLDRYVTPLIDELHTDIADDLEDIQEHRMTNTLWMVIITLAGLLVFSFLVLSFHKVEARWGGLPVILPTAIGLALLAGFIPQTEWFHRAGYTPFWIFLVPTIGLAVTLWIGISRTENTGLLFSSKAQAVEYNIIRPAGYLLFDTVNVGGVQGISLDLPSCDGDSCAVYLVIGLIVLVLVLVIGSAMIPHFWLLSGSLMLCMMALITLHDLRIRQKASAAKAPASARQSRPPPPSYTPHVDEDQNWDDLLSTARPVWHAEASKEEVQNKDY